MEFIFIFLFLFLYGVLITRPLIFVVLMFLASHVALSRCVQWKHWMSTFAADLRKDCKHEFKLYVMLCLPVVSYIFQVGHLQLLDTTVVSVSSCHV